MLSLLGRAHEVAGGVVHQHVQPAEPLDGPVHQPLDALRVTAKVNRHTHADGGEDQSQHGTQRLVLHLPTTGNKSTVAHSGRTSRQPPDAWTAVQRRWREAPERPTIAIVVRSARYAANEDATPGDSACMIVRSLAAAEGTLIWEFHQDGAGIKQIEAPPLRVLLGLGAWLRGDHGDVAAGRGGIGEPG